MAEVEQRQPRHNLQTLPAKTLLHYVKKDDLIQALGQQNHEQIKQQARAEGKKLTAKHLKSVVVTNIPFVESIRNSPLGELAYQKYWENYMRITDPGVRAKSTAVRQLMSEPRRGFTGCVATRVQPQDFEFCVENYDDPEFQDISLVPSRALKQSAYQKTGQMVLAPPADGDPSHISYLPRGLRNYIKKHPGAYQEYLEERRAELEHLRAVRRNVRREAEDEPPVGDGGQKRIRGQGEGWC